MMKPLTKIPNLIEQEKSNLWLFAPLLFASGAAFYISFPLGFLSSLKIFLAFFAVCLLLFFLNRASFRSLVFIGSAIFLAGSFYAIIYQKTFLNYTKITGKVYVDGYGKVESIKTFYNPINRLEGATIVLSKPVLYKSEFVQKITKPKIKKTSLTKSGKPRKPRKPRAPKPPSEKKILKTFVNVKNYLDLDREFVDISANYQIIKWQDKNGRPMFPKPPTRILINIVKNPKDVAINDIIALKLRLEPVDKKEFPGDFDFAIDADAKKIGAYGFGFGEVRILKKAEISSLDQWFNEIRKKINNRILAIIPGDAGGIAITLLTGERSLISKDVMNDIRNSGLAHLISISGFHLSLASAIFFVITRFLLSRSEYLTLNYDIKKIAAVIAMFGSYFYLGLSGAPLPAERAFLMVLFILACLLFDKSPNPKRVVMSALFVMVIYNPYAVFNIGLQLSFVAIMTLILGAEILAKYKENFNKIIWYFLEIIALSILIEITTLPFLMHSFQSIALLGFVANILAIPLAGFFVMPLGFLAIFLMPIALEKYVLILMKYGILLIEKIAFFVAHIDNSTWISPQLSSLGLIIAISGFFITCFTKSYFRFFGILVFLSSFTTLALEKKPDILFDKEQKFFAIYDKKDGLIFSNKLRPSRHRDNWMKEMNEDEFKYLKNYKKEKGVWCEKNQCLIERSKKVLVVLKRQKDEAICEKDFDVIVNLTAKYALPNCVKNKVVIDNIDFYKKGGQFFYFDGEGRLEIRGSAE